MENSNKPSYPVTREVISNAHVGLTKREYFAGLAMQGIMTNNKTEPTIPIHFQNIAEDAVRIADELLKQLEK